MIILRQHAFSEEPEQKEFGKVKAANKALKKALELKTGEDAVLKNGIKHRWDMQSLANKLKDKGNSIREGRKNLREIVPEMREDSIKETYKKADINKKINIKDNLVNSKDTKLRIQLYPSEAKKIHPNRPSVEFKELGNSKKNIKKSNISERDKETLLQEYDHGRVDQKGRLKSGRDMGYGNFEHNVFRASSGHGYRQTW